MIIDVRDQVTSAIEHVMSVWHPRNLNPIIAAAEVNLFKNHFAGLPANKHNWPSTHYWGEAAKSTSWQLTADGFLVRVSRIGVHMHATGQPETITPIRAKNLAIPAVPAAYGRRPGEFSNLKVAFRRVGGQLQAYALVEGATEDGQKTRRMGGYDTHKLRTGMVQKRIIGRDGVTRYFSFGMPKTTKWIAHRGEVIYWLVKEVHPKQYPGVLPTEQEMRQTAIDAAESALQ